jgi:hypothetical protein
MNDDFGTLIIPGQLFEANGSFISTSEGFMQGTVTLRTVMKQAGHNCWLAEIIGIAKPEWEWMLGKVVSLNTDYVKEQVSKQF